MIYITGDTHSDFSRFDRFSRERNTSADDIMIILGDSGLNYHGNYRDNVMKEKASAYPLTFFCIYGNHEKRAELIYTYRTKVFCGGEVYYEEKYPNLLFAKDGEVYRFGAYDAIAIGGAFSIDRMRRVAFGYPWHPDEQPSPEIKKRVEDCLAEKNNKIDVVLSHTCPRKYEPKEVFLDGYDQHSIDKTTEDWLDGIENRTDYRYWYCGHFHTKKKVDNVRFMFDDIDEFMGG